MIDAQTVQSLGQDTLHEWLPGYHSLDTNGEQSRISFSHRTSDGTPVFSVQTPTGSSNYKKFTVKVLVEEIY